jgi:hypothetical protein
MVVDVVLPGPGTVVGRVGAGVRLVRWLDLHHLE